MLPSRSRPMPPVATSSPRGGKRYKLGRAAAAVHVEDRAMDEAGLVAGQVADRRGDLLRGGRTPGRGQRGELVELVAHHLGTLGARRSRADRVDPDPARPELRRPCLGEQGQRGLAGCPHCTEYLAQMRETISLTGRLEPEDLTPQMRDEFTDLYRRWRSEQQ